MNDDTQGRTESFNVTPIIGFALGALIGGALGLLLAPASGERTRRRLGNAARRMSRDARKTLEDARDNVTEAASGLGTDVKAAIDAGRGAFQHDHESKPARSTSRVAPELMPPPRG
jgi:gas vesicle protein